MVVVGVASSSKREARLYLEAVSSRGADVSLLAPRALGEIGPTLASIDGLMLTGGPDVDPPRYGEARDPAAGLHLSPRRDRWELALLKAALEREMPVLAICRGMQLLNVAFGGRLIQHLDGHSDGSGKAGSPSILHRLYISPGSKLAATLGSGGFARVNSRHHQGLREAQKARTLMASAYSLEDGLIEALESPAHDWVVGVQWHNEIEEEMPKGFGNLFLALIRRAERYSVADKTGSGAPSLAPA